MPKEEKVGAPYKIIKRHPGLKDSKPEEYRCDTTDDVLHDITTLVLVHIKQNIRGKTGIRTVFEIVPIRGGDECGTKLEASSESS